MDRIKRHQKPIAPHMKATLTVPVSAGKGRRGSQGESPRPSPSASPQPAKRSRPGELNVNSDSALSQPPPTKIGLITEADLFGEVSDLIENDDKLSPEKSLIMDTSISSTASDSPSDGPNCMICGSVFDITHSIYCFEDNAAAYLRYLQAFIILRLCFRQLFVEAGNTLLKCNQCNELVHQVLVNFIVFCLICICQKPSHESTIIKHLVLRGAADIERSIEGSALYIQLHEMRQEKNR